MNDTDFAAGMGRLEELLARTEESCAPEALPVIRELVRSLLDVHRMGLAELLGALDDANPSNVDLVRAVASRPAVAGLLLMHDLHPDALALRVEAALREANGASAGSAAAELVRLDGADVLVRISGKRAAVRVLAKIVERTLGERAPDGTLHLDVVTLDDALPENVVPITRLRRPGGAA